MHSGQTEQVAEPLSDRSVGRPVIVLGIDYPDGHVSPPHRHRRAQFLYGSTGVVQVSTPDGSWMMPPERGLWIPAGTEHDVRMLGPVAMCSLYIDEASVGDLPDRCEVVGVPGLMRSLLVAATNIAPEYDEDGRDGALVDLMLHELRRLPPLPLSLPFPAHDALARKCRAFFQDPDARASIERWCRDVGMSRRTFTRTFRRETGYSFVAWRQRACLLAALPRLADGESVTSIALGLGYENPASFTLMFKRILGAAPTAFAGRRDP